MPTTPAPIDPKSLRMCTDGKGGKERIAIASDYHRFRMDGRGGKKRIGNSSPRREGVVYAGIGMKTEY
jgi:hypothetical protein